MEQQKADALAERLFNEVNGAMSVYNLFIGYRLGLFRAMAEEGPVTAEALAARTDCHPRYVREWLGAMAAGRYVEHEAEVFGLSPEQRAVYLDADNPAHALPNTGFLASIGSVVPKLLEAFRSGRGVPFADYGADFVDAQGEAYRPVFVNELPKWIDAIPDVRERLERGARVADVGCGVGWSSIVMARKFPECRVVGIDSDERSIERARANAEAAGLSGRVRFEAVPAESADLRNTFDVATLFECLHDMSHPVEALRGVRSLLREHGTVILTDEKVGETLADNVNPLGQLYFNFSVLHCLPQSLAHENSAGLGAVMRPSEVERLAREAGFTRVERLPIETALFHVYRFDI